MIAFDIVDARRAIVDHLAERGWVPRDSDGADFANPDDPEIRFKIGTSYSEVAATVWRGQAQIGAIRATRREHVPDMKTEIDLWITGYYPEGDPV